MRLTTPRLTAGALAAAGFICALLDLVVAVTAVDAAAGLLVLLVIPGAAIINAVDPWRVNLRSWERLFWTVTASVGVTALGGLVLNFVGGLTAVHWATLGAVVAVGAGGVAWWRGLEGPVVSGFSGARLGRGWPRGFALWLVAAIVTAAALSLSVYSSVNERPERFAQLWILPIPFNAGSFAARASVGVTNEENRRAAFVVRVLVGRRTVVAGRRVVLGQGQTWTYGVSRTVSQTVQATVALASSPSSILSSVTLATPVK
jgi:uncharacterized membrane protein